MCAPDVDAICACKILQFLLESHNLQYSVVPVASVEEFSQSFEEYRNSVDAIVLINFGNLINIPKLLKPPENLNFYVIDSHRPIDVHNYYTNPHVKIYVNKNEDNLNIPQKERLFRLNSAGQLDEDDQENLALLTAEAQELSNEQLERRRKLRDWLVKKQTLLFDYEEFHFYNRAVSLIMYDLAYFLSRDNNYLVWLGIIGLTYQEKANKINESMFEEEAKRLVRHTARHQVSLNQAKGSQWRIDWVKELNLCLHRKWTLYDSFAHSPLTVCKFQLWNDKGQCNLHEFLVECGLKLDQCRKPFAAMDLRYRHNLIEDVSRVCLGDLQYKYEIQDLIKRCFVMSCGFKDHFVASDIVHAIRAVLDSSDLQMSPTEKFVRALQSLSHDEFELLEIGVDLAKGQMKAMFEQVKSLITTGKVTDFGLFLKVDLQDQGNSVRLFARGNSLTSFARFLLDAYIYSKPHRIRKRAVKLPLILLCPDFRADQQVVIVGIPPFAQETKRNFFAKAFEQSAVNMDCDFKCDLSETSLVRIDANLKNLFLDQLRLILGE